MRHRFLILFAFSFLTTSMAGQDWNLSKIAPGLQTVLEEEPEAYHTVQVLLANKVAPRTLEARFRSQNLLMKARGQQMITALQDRAAEVQPAVIDQLRGVPGVRLEKLQRFWITNMIALDVNLQGATALSQLAAVSWMDINWEMIFPDACDMAPAPPAPNSREPGLEAIGAPFMWNLGYTGYGRKVLVVDTGHDLDHPAIQHNFAGQQLPIEQAWANGGRPYFCGNHGTHVGGTITGIDRVARDTIGVAYGALWQGSSTSDCQSSGGTALDALQIFEWAMDPDGNPATIDDRPDVINNSWSRDYPIQDDCGDPIHRLVADALYAAGIAVVFSASNEGPDPATIGDPPMENWDTVRMFSVGALNGNTPSLPIAGFSSRGPTVCGGEGSLHIKPEVSAPGVAVRSAIAGGAYGQLDGTSMAAPHVSGALLLLKEAFPELAGEELMLALYYSCTDLGPPGEDNDYGMGIISLPAAYNYLLQKGHLPAAPVHADNDLSLLTIEQSAYFCENTLATRFLIEHNGIDTISSFLLTYSVGPVSGELPWEGTLLPGDRVWLDFPELELPSGQYELDAEVVMANGQPDARHLDNRQKRRVRVLDKERIPVSVEGEAPTCQGGTATLRAEYDGEAVYQWFDQAQGGNLLHTGPVLQLDNLTEAQKVYLDSRIVDAVPTPELQENSNLASNAQAGIVFDAYAPFVLSAVTIHATETGGRMIRLTGPGDTNKSQIVMIEEPGIHRVNLDFIIETPGEGYALSLYAGRPLTYTPQANDYFPTEIEEVLEIKGATDSTGQFYYFYDWEVVYDYFCDRTPVEVPVSTTVSSGTIQIIPSAQELDLANSEGTIGFEINPTGQEILAWHWNFGDGIVSNLPTPSHTFERVGSYPVSVVVETADGCTESAIIWINVTDSTPPASTEESDTQIQLKVFPNPVKDQLLLQFDLPNSQEARIRLLDVYGRTHTTQTARLSRGVPHVLPMANLPAGAYLVVIELENGRWVRRVIKT